MKSHIGGLHSMISKLNGKIKINHLWIYKIYHYSKHMNTAKKHPEVQGRGTQGQKGKNL
jgi:hypothetical protein